MLAFYSILKIKGSILANAAANMQIIHLCPLSPGPRDIFSLTTTPLVFPLSKHVGIPNIMHNIRKNKTTDRKECTAGLQNMFLSCCAHTT